MSETTDLISHYTEVRNRLINPPNSVVDKPINLHPNRVPKPNVFLIPIPAVLVNHLTAKVSIEVIHRLPIPDIEPKKLKLSSINKAVCKHYRISMAEIKGRARTVRQVIPRHIIFYLACCHTGLSLPQIARRVGGRDHTTIMSGRDHIKEMLLVDEDLQHTVKLIEYKLFAGYYDTDNPDNTSLASRRESSVA